MSSINFIIRFYRHSTTETDIRNRGVHVYMILGMITLVLFIIFLAFYLTDRRRMINGFLFNLFFISFLIFGCYIGFLSEIYALRMIALIPILIVIFMATFGLFALMVSLFLNARILMRREGRRFSNALTFLLGMGVLLMIVFPMIAPARYFPSNFQMLFTGGSDHSLDCISL